MEKFNESLPFDKRLWAEDIKVRHREGGEWWGGAGGDAGLVARAGREDVRG